MFSIRSAISFNSFDAFLNDRALSEYMTLGNPLLAVTLRNASRKPFAVMSVTSSKCTANVDAQVKITIYAFWSRCQSVLAKSGPAKSSTIVYLYVGAA